ncbi:MAG TPA: FecR domain-containing protein [Gemmatimonadaceae bacterium]|nr:FecR domain-containing protein [Gemmatimonadaceae bacterium]
MTPSEEQVRAAVAQQAGTWFIANQSGSLEQAERADFMAWLKASPIHVEEYLGVALVAHDLPAAAEDPRLPLESLLELARADDTDRVVPIEASLSVREPARRIRAPYRRSFATSIAAVALLLAASVLWWMRDGEFLGLPKAYQTAHGEQAVAQLPDGTELHLNTDSAVTVRYTRSERVVEIARGQALFTVARDDHRRFRVAAGDVHVVAVGTRFDSYRRPDATIVTVVEGSVAVLSGSPPPPGVTGFPPGALRVNAGYQVHVDTGGVSAQPIPVDVQQTVAWLQRKIAFEQRPLGEVADEFNRYVPIPIEIDEAALRALPISGVFDAYDIDSFVAFLQALDGVRVERTNARIRVYSVKLEK